MIKRAFYSGSLTVYINDDGTWDGTVEDAARFPQVEVEELPDGSEDMSPEEIAEKFSAMQS